MTGDQFHYIATGAMGVLVAALLLLILLWPKSIHHTYSQHAAQSRHLIIYHVVVFCLTFPTLAWVWSAYISPKFQIMPVATWLMWLAVVLQIACTCVPEIKPFVAQHRFLAGSSAILLGLVIAVTACGLNHFIPLQLLLTALTAAMLITALTSIWISPRYSLIYQSLYYVLFLAGYLTLLFAPN